jgi:hypothetical protein
MKQTINIDALPDDLTLEQLLGVLRAQGLKPVITFEPVKPKPEED